MLYALSSLLGTCMHVQLPVGKVVRKLGEAVTAEWQSEPLPLPHMCCMLQASL